MMEREIIYLTVAAFPVAVERVIHPELRGRPVVVAPLGSARSIVTALSAEAWNAGIRKGMALAKAMRYCRSTIVLPPNEPLYLRASRAIFKVLESFSPVLEPSGHGHAYLDITGTGRLFGPPRDTAWKAQKEIRRQLRLDAALGIASNKMVSKIASEVTRPAGLQDVPHGNESAFLSPLPVRLLPGVGLQTERQFDDLNIRIIHDVAAMRLDLLTLAFGRFGFVLHQRAQGIDRTPVYPMRTVPALEQGKVLPEDSNDYEVLKGVLLDLVRAGGKTAAGEEAVRGTGGTARPVRRLPGGRTQPAAEASSSIFGGPVRACSAALGCNPETPHARPLNEFVPDGTFPGFDATGSVRRPQTGPPVEARIRPRRPAPTLW